MTPTTSVHARPEREEPFWLLPRKRLLADLHCGAAGLSTSQAAARLRRYGPNGEPPPRRSEFLTAMARRVAEPLNLLLLAATFISAATGDLVSAAAITVMVAVSLGLETVQEHRAARAAELLRRSVALRAEVRRDGAFRSVPVERVAPGDLIRLRAGEIVPADALLLRSENLSVNQAALTGEAYPAEKTPGAAAGPSPSEASNALFRGSVVVTGEGQALVCATGPATVFGAAASALGEQEAASPFQRDLRELGLLIARATGVLALAVLGLNVLLGRPALPSLMFAVALAVGLTPELLPVIATVTLSRGAVRMSRRKVIVKRLASIHDLGAMTVLCTDKTGTLTSGLISCEESLDPEGRPDPRAGRLAAACASLAGDRGALDAALIGAWPEAARGSRALRRYPFDYRSRLGGVWIGSPEGTRLLAKGAPESVLAGCAHAREGGGAARLTARRRATILRRLRASAARGLRVIAIASRDGPPHPDDGAPFRELVLEGFCTFADPLKPTARGAVETLAERGVRVVVLSGDDPLIVERLGQALGWTASAPLSGAELGAMSGERLATLAARTSLFARLTPDQKVRVIRALKDRGEIVGYLGDGVNDAPALKAADIGLSVEGATGVARAAADMILLAPDLAVVAAGVEEGRRTFANILKYVRMGASSNFGNMLSMALASAFLPFLPMLASQILLNNLLYDLSGTGIPFDRVASAETARPQRWRIGAVARYAMVMGPLSSIFDLITFLVLLRGFRVDAAGFRTAWFLESIATQILVIFLIRTRAPFWRDRPDQRLTLSALLALGAALAVPFTPFGAWLGFEPLGGPLIATLGAIVLAYLGSVEALKRVATAAS